MTTPHQYQLLMYRMDQIHQEEEALRRLKESQEIKFQKLFGPDPIKQKSCQLTPLTSKKK